MFYCYMDIEAILQRNPQPSVLFEVLGDPDSEETHYLCRDIIRAGSEPMLWGGVRKLPLIVIKAGNGFALVRRSGERKLIYTAEIENGEEILCLQTYDKTVTKDELAVLLQYSHFIYGLQIKLNVSEEEMAEMQIKMRLLLANQKNKRI